MTDDDKPPVDCYARGDRRLMVLSQRLRARLLGPILIALHRCGVTANVLTAASLVAGLAFCPVFFYSRALALALLGLHVCLDGLDGPLARQAHTASRKGSFTDTMTDQLVVAATTVTLLYARVIAPLPGGIYVFAYTIVIGFSMVRNALSIPYTWLVRPRLAVYLWLVVELYVLPGSIDYVLWFFVVLLALKMISGFIKIRRRI